jgi:hypothetical protein
MNPEPNSPLRQSASRLPEAHSHENSFHRSGTG